MCITQLQNYTMTCQEHILMNTMIHLTLKEVKQAPNDPANLMLDKNDYSKWYKEKSGDGE